jgi:osmotically-inducible protein OsmY
MLSSSILKTLTTAVILGVLAHFLQGCSPTGTVLGAGARTGLALAEDRPVEEIWGDTLLKLTINKKLLETSFSETFWSLNTTIFEGRVLITGNVKNTTLRDQVSQMVWGVKGVREVLNEIEIQETNNVTQIARDKFIQTSLQARMLGDKIVSDINYKMIAHNNVLYIIGVAQSQAELEKVVAHARAIRYVKRFVNYIWLADNPSRSR